MGLWPQSWPTGGPGTGLEDKELRAADTQSRTAVLCSLSTRSNVTHLQPPSSLHLPLPSHTPLTSEHEPTHRGSNYPFPRRGWPWVLDPEATVLCALLTLSLWREREGGRGTEKRQALSQKKWQCLFKVTSYSHAACQSQEFTQRLAAPEARQLGAGKADGCINPSSSPLTQTQLLDQTPPKALTHTSCSCVYFLLTGNMDTEGK